MRRKEGKRANASDVPVAIRGGKVGEVKVSCEGSAVITVADDAEVGSIAVADSAEGTSIFVKGSVAEIETSAANTMVYGSGEVGTVSVGSTADNTSVTTPNTVINNGGASGVTAAGGKEVPVVGSVQNNATGTNIVTSPAPSDGGETGTTPTPTPTPQPQPIPQVPAGPVVVPVYGVRIEGTPELRQVLTAVVNPSSATVKYQWLRSDDGVNFEEIEGATGRTYTLTEEDVGKYIKVKVTGVQFYFGTAESTSVYVDTAYVSTYDEFIKAIDNAKVTKIVFTNDITTEEKIVLNKLTRPLTIDGNGHALNFTGDKTGWQGNYVLHVYRTTNVLTLKDIKITGGDAGLYVNGSYVKLVGTVDVSGNEFGGIEVSKGTNVTAEPWLDVTIATICNESETYVIKEGTVLEKNPTIWEDDIGEENSPKRVIGGKFYIYYFINDDDDDGKLQRFYIIDNANVSIDTHQE